MTTAVVERAWQALHSVLDPEVPALSVCDLGIVRGVHEDGDALEVVLTPTYSGCPATEVIEQGVRDALAAAGFDRIQVRLQRAPAWSSDWISAEGRQKLRDYGIAPPGPAAARDATPIRFIGRSQTLQAIDCPRCGSSHTERLSAFGATACKSLWRCLDCREPFEHFKPL